MYINIRGQLGTTSESILPDEPRTNPLICCCQGRGERHCAAQAGRLVYVPVLDIRFCLAR